MNAELIFNGLLVLLVLWFIADIVSSRSQIPKPKPVPQKRKEPEEGAEAAEAPQEAPAEAKEAPCQGPGSRP